MSRKSGTPDVSLDKQKMIAQDLIQGATQTSCMRKYNLSQGAIINVIRKFLTLSVSELKEQALNKARLELKDVKDWSDIHRQKSIQQVYALQSLDIDKPANRRIVLDACKEATDRTDGKAVQKNINANIELRQHEDKSIEELEALLS